VREKEKITQTIILVHSLPKLHLFPRKPLGIPLGNQQQITTHHTLKEVILTTQENTPSLTSHTVRTTLWLYRYTDYKYSTGKTITREYGTYYTWLQEIAVAHNPLFNQSTTQGNLSFLNPNFQKIFFWITFCCFEIGRVILAL